MAPSIELEGVSDVGSVQIPDPLTINSVEAWRTKAGKLVAGVAAKPDVDLFKGVGRHAHKPKAKRWDNRISQESSTRKSSSIKGAAQYLSRPGIISLGGGLPSSEYFPFDSYSFKVPRVGHFSEAETHESGTTITAGKHDMTEDKSLLDISVAFNYGQGTGSPQLLRWVIEHTEIVHNPKYSDWSCTLTVGSTSAVDMCLRMLGHQNMCILSEQYAFATAVESALPMGITTIGVRMDDEGMIPESMDRILTKWDPTKHNGSPKPFLVYVVPSGQNPTGATQSLQRRKDIYAVAQKHDLLLIEDEPYYFLQMQTYVGQDAPAPPPPASHSEFLSGLVPSLLSLDTDGRVIRMDSFSKVIAPGLRCGWITAPTQLIQQYVQHADQSTQGASGFSQLALYKLLDEHWGHSGFLDWLIYIRMEYTRRRNVILGACEKHLPAAIVRWKPPMAGMFHWLEIDWTKHPLANTMDMRELEDRIWLKSIEMNALLIKGSWFLTEKGEEKPGEEEAMFFRATYAAAPEAKIVEAVRRFGEAIRVEFGLANETNGTEHAAVNGHVANGNA